MNEHALRQAIIDRCLEMNASGLNQGTAGNISVRFADQMLITPSAVPYAKMTPEMIVSMPLDGGGQWDGPKKPSSEWRFHLDIMNDRPEIRAVVHAHPTWCTALAMLRKDIPAAHYMIAAFGGSTVRCAAFATFGTAELSRNALAALKDRTACLLANHGAIAIGADLDTAMWRAVELEALARQYAIACQTGEPVILSDDEIATTLAAFKGYGVSED